MDSVKTPKGEKTKRRITEAAIELINEKGVENVTLIEICEKSGAANGTFYHYFKSVNDIVYEVLRIEGEEFLKYFRSTETDSPEDRLNKLLDFQLDYYEKKGKAVVARLLGNEFIPYAGDSKIEQLHPIRTCFEEVVADGQRQGSFSKKSTPQKISMLMEGMLLGYSLLWVRDKTDKTLRDIACEHFTEIINLLILK